MWCVAGLEPYRRSLMPSLAASWRYTPWSCISCSIRWCLFKFQKKIGLVRGGARTRGLSSRLVPSVVDAELGGELAIHALILHLLIKVNKKKKFGLVRGGARTRGLSYVIVPSVVDAELGGELAIHALILHLLIQVNKKKNNSVWCVVGLEPVAYRMLSYRRSLMPSLAASWRYTPWSCISCSITLRRSLASRRGR
jgi:hypothetical protein